MERNEEYSRWTFSKLVVVAMATMLAVACGGGGGSDTAAPSTGLSGAWYGSYDYVGSPSTITVNIDSNNAITSVVRDGSNLYLTGTISNIQNELYEFSLYYSGTYEDGGGFLLDASAQHAGFLTEGGDFGLLQRNATQLPTYYAADIAGAWAGYSIAVDALGNVVSYGVSSATVNADGTFSGTGPFGDFSNTVGYPFTIWNDYYGTYTARYDNPTQSVTGGFVKVWLSVDKRFAASYACDTSTRRPAHGLAYCTYNSWTKQ